MKEYRLVPHPCGSWKYQKRFALKSYSPRQLKNGKIVWRLDEIINRFIKPTWQRTQPWVNEYLNKNFGRDIYYSLHNKEILGCNPAKT